MFCYHCGKQIKDRAKVCPYCGAKMTQTYAKARKKRPHKRWRMVVILALVVILVAAGVLAALYWNARQSNSESEEVSASDSLLILTDTFTDRTVTDEDSAVLAAQDAAEVMGLENAMEELEPTDTTEVSGDVYYCLQQYYQGIPVFGRTVVITADENGTVLSLSGNVADIDSGISLTAKVTQEELAASFAAYAEEELELSGDVLLDEISDDALVIYDLYGGEKSCLAYELSAWTEAGEYIVVLDAKDAEVLLAYETVSDLTVTGTNSSGTITVNASQSEEDEDTYVLYDEERKIKIYDLNGASSEIVIGYSSDGEEITRSDMLGDLVTSQEVSSETVAVFDDDAVSYMSTLSSIYDAYEGLGIKSAYVICANYNDSYSSGKNARGSAGTLTDTIDMVGYISTGSVTGVSDIDVLAHEFAHYIMDSHSPLTSDYSGSISEGFADIYGCLIECEIEGWDAPDWSIVGDNINVYRDMANPSASGDASYWNGEDVSGEPYKYSTIISHAAYLMWTGKDSAIGIGQTYGELSVDELAELWYRAMLMFPSDCDFHQVCQLVELAAEHMSLSDDQKECISWAFYQVGIAETYTLNTDFDLTLYDTNGNKYADYYASVEVVLSNKASSADAAVIYEPSEDGILSFHLDDGKAYQITLVDNQDDTKEFVFYAYISDKSGSDALTLYTDFGTLSTGTLSGTVVDATNGTSIIAGATVTVIGEDGTVAAELTTDEDGEFSGQFTPGNYAVTVTTEGYETTTVSMSVIAGEFTFETIALESVVDVYTAYEVILNEYREACAISSEDYLADSEKYEQLYPDVNAYVMYQYHVPYHASPSGDGADEPYELAYAYYDIDQNGTPELLIIQAFHESYICDLYAFNGTSAVKLFPDITFLEGEVETSYLFIYADGTLCVSSGDSDLYRLNDDGYTLSSISWENWTEVYEEVNYYNSWEQLADDISYDGSNASYDAVLESYCTAFSEGWDMQQFSDAGLCYLCYAYDASEVGYTFIDINLDGTEELLIGVVEGTEDYYEPGYFFELYTILDGEVTLVISGWERNRYYLCSDYAIANEGSSSAAYTIWAYYSFTGNVDLSIIEAVIYDGWYDNENPWFFCEKETEDAYGILTFAEVDYVPVSESEAREKIASYEYTAIQFIPFSDRMSDE